MGKTGIFLSSVVYVSMGAITLLSLSSCSRSTKVAKVIPVEASIQASGSQTAATQSGPFQLDKVTEKTAQARAPASLDD